MEAPKTHPPKKNEKNVAQIPTALINRTIILVCNQKLLHFPNSRIRDILDFQVTHKLLHDTNLLRFVSSMVN